MNNSTENKPDRKDLKIIALRQRISKLVSDYEDQDADRRVEITEMAERIEYLEGQLNEQKGDSDDKVSAQEDPDATSE